MTQPMSRFRTLVLALLVAVVAGCASTDRQPSTGEIIDDSVITTRVKTRLFNEEGFDSLKVSVETYRGTVQLSGFVDNDEQRLKAAQIAAGVPGVKAVDNALRIR